MFLCILKGAPIWFVACLYWWLWQAKCSQLHYISFLNCSNRTGMAVSLLSIVALENGFFLLFIGFFCVNPPPVPEALAQEVFGGSCPCEAVSWGIFCLMVSQEATLHTWVRSCLSYWLGCFVDQLLLWSVCAQQPILSLRSLHRIIWVKFDP